MTTLPPGVSAANFAAALRKFEAAIGKEWVFSSDAEVALYRDAYSIFWGEPEERLASAAVAPNSTEQVQQIVRIANEYKIPLYPISTGKNLGYGGSAPNLTGSVVVDLKRMNKVLEVDDKRHFALVEPGVAYFDLYRHIQERKLKVWVDVPDPGWGSVIGNALDRGIGYTMPQFRDHFGAHCGMEVVLPNGEVIRTGMGALPKAKSWQDYRYGFGPYVDGLFSQGNFGIVTKMGFALMPQPEAYLAASVMVPKREDLIPLVHGVNLLENSGMIGLPNLRSPLTGGGAGPGGPPPPELGALLKKPNGATPAELQRYADDKQLPFWAAGLRFYGPEKVIRAQWEYAKEHFSAAIAGATFREDQFFKLPLTSEEQERVQHTAFGIPAMSVFSMGTRTPMNPSPSDGHVWFMPVLPRTGEAILEAQEVFSSAFRREEIKPMFGSEQLGLPTTWYAKSFIYGMGFTVSRSNAEQNKKTRETVKRMIKLAGEHGWGEYRAPPAFQEAVLEQYSFNNHSLHRFTEALHDGIDPNGIMAPGRYGIWPKHLRSKKA